MSETVAKRAKKQAPAKKGASARGTPPPTDLEWRLSELPSSQHRAGLAGLVLAVRHRARSAEARGVCEIVDLSSTGLRLRIDRDGMQSLFDVVYAASLEEQESPTIRKKGKGDAAKPVPPVRTDRREEVDPRTGKKKQRVVYVYLGAVPRGGPLLELDPTRDGDRGAWIKLWRDMVWSILRGVPKTRIPYQDRAEGEACTDGEEMYELVTRSPSKAVDLRSSHYLGAQDHTADLVSFEDEAKLQFLLHFWPFAAGVYDIWSEDADGDSTSAGYAIAVPDVSDLRAFCEELPEALRLRSKEMERFRPKAGIVALPAEAGLDLMDVLRDQLARREGKTALGELVAGIDVLHTAKEGNNVRIHWTGRVEPRLEVLDEFRRLRDKLTDPLTRRVRLVNLLARRPRLNGLDRLFAERPYERFLSVRHASDGARRLAFRARGFKADALYMLQEEVGMSTEGDKGPRSLEAIVLQIVTSYVARRMEAKHGLSWAGVKDDDAKRGQYQDERERLAKNAFLSVRSRTGSDFVSYFSGTLCSVPQHLAEQDFTTLSKALKERSDDVRTITLLALSARS